MQLTAYICMILAVISNIIGNIFLKMGATIDSKLGILFGFLGWHNLGAVVFFAIAMLGYSFALRVMPLHIAQSLSSMQFVGSIAAAALFFGEPISGLKWLGITFICVGLGLIAF